MPEIAGLEGSPRKLLQRHGATRPVVVLANGSCQRDKCLPS